MAKYVCVSADIRTVENGANTGRPFAVAKFSPKGVSVLVAPRPKTMTFFCELQEDKYDMWTSMWEKVAEGTDKLEIDAVEVSITMPPHYKLDAEGNEFANSSTGEVLVFDKINLFVLADTKGNPIGNPQAEAERIFRNSCRPVDAAPAAQPAQPAATAAINLTAGAVAGDVTTNTF